MKKIIVLNHKSSINYEKARNYPVTIDNYIRKDQIVIICPSSAFIPYFKGKYNFKLGSQNISSENITGELTGSLLKSMEVRYVLIGTNDRKKYEDERLINNKIKETIKYNMIPIVTIGETYYEKELNKTAYVINKQIQNYLKDVEVKEDIIICYTPNWSYEGKQVPNEEYICEVIDLIKSIIKRKYNANIKVIYGGKITEENILKIDKIKNIDGYLIEKQSTNIKDTINILNSIE